ncbi:MAG TPA: hypothetical protein VFJ48_05050 [Casimicrobiaceae bacterium]|nr:hypothetical protein [Casimicrobiaceae bacterium]
MDHRSLARLLLLIAAALFPTLAAALDETYEGMLEPENRDPKIPIVVQLRDLGLSIQGTVKTSGTYKLTAPILAGDNAFGQCTISVQLSLSVGLRMNGPCDPASFSGTYVLADKQKRTRNFGTFNLARRSPEALKADARRAPTTTGSCLKANTQCLLACPRTEESADFFCSNRCRVKLNACKERLKKAPIPEGE